MSNKYWAGLLLLLLGGCGSSGTGASVHGQVTVDGTAIETGSLQFLPIDGKGQPVGAEIKQGAYEVSNVPPGKVNVTITAMNQTGETVDEWGRKSPDMISLVPAKYAQGYPIDVVAGNQEIPIELKSTP